MTFQLDTSGSVILPRVDAGDGALYREPISWADLTPFTQGYIEALFEALGPYNWMDEQGGAWPSKFSDLAPETLARIIADCEAVQKRVADRLFVCPDGATFWTQRQTRFARVGAEDRGWAVAHFPPQTVQLCDDGKVRFAPATGAAA